MADIKVRVGQTDAIKVLATSVSGGISTTNVVTDSLVVSGITTLGITTTSSLNVSGIITAASYRGDGSFLTGVTVTGVGTLPNLNVTGISTLTNVQISSGIITAKSGIVTYYGDIAQIDGGSFWWQNQIVDNH